MQFAAPQLSGLKRNIHGLKQILGVLYGQAVGTRNRKEAALSQIFAAMPEVPPVLLQYYTEVNVRAGDAMLYDDLINWIRVALVDPMNNWSHELDMGLKTLEQCREAAIRVEPSGPVLTLTLLGKNLMNGEFQLIPFTMIWNMPRKGKNHNKQQYLKRIRRMLWLPDSQR